MCWIALQAVQVILCMVDVVGIVLMMVTHTHTHTHTHTISLSLVSLITRFQYFAIFFTTIHSYTRILVHSPHSPPLSLT